MNRVGHLLVIRDFSNFELCISKSGKGVFLWFCFYAVFKGCFENLENGLVYISKICIAITNIQIWEGL